MGSQSLNNPTVFTSTTDLFVAVLNILMIISTPIVVFFIILAGFKYVTARGNPQQIEEASKALLYGVIGGVVILASTAILAIIKNLVSSF